MLCARRRTGHGLEGAVTVYQFLRSEYLMRFPRFLLQFWTGLIGRGPSLKDILMVRVDLLILTTS